MGGRTGIRVNKLALGTFDLNFLADSEERKVSGDVTLLVCLLSLLVACVVTIIGSLTNLDNQVKVSFVVIQSGGSVRSNNLLAINLGSDRDVLTDGETERIRCSGKGKSVPGYIRENQCEKIKIASKRNVQSSVVGQVILVNELERPPLNRVKYFSVLLYRCPEQRVSSVPLFRSFRREKWERTDPGRR